MATTSTKTIPQRPARQAAKSWTLDLPAEEDKGPMNVSLPKSLLADLELLKTHFNTTQATLVERCLRHALSTNADLQRLKASGAANAAEAATTKA